ncbi:transcriptional regulator FeaR [Burkholderia glumae]|uniref:Transcriptional regulator FeaR n=2 Tax=Burkholderia glumae TaxID=337 RepID=A0ABY5B7I5_BURGL|nr:transcriptional regulator FeaR [Burkholderia glumae]MCM2484130.1 transcriptional regulator FeaR [Burkholderia glumae]MCM2509820.1 transcriptional regulator FeaR [Burkholderia glumae]MCM2539583.1 transcriptional regulator FeaR [Burkholderia glumae]USS42993.1 transcriptional regulator FeaR [Burkholderia glumae]
MASACRPARRSTCLVPNRAPGAQAMTPQAAARFARWSDEVLAICGRFQIRPPEHADLFLGDIRRRSLGGLEIADIRTNAGSIRRQPRRAGSLDDRYCFLVLQREGAVRVGGEQAGFVLEAGEMALLDSAQSFEMRPQGLLHQMSVHLPREAFDTVARAGNGFGKLSRRGLSGQLLRDMLLRLTVPADDGDVTQDEGAALREALGALSRGALCGEPPGGDAPLRLRAQRQILMNLQDEDQSVARLARQLGVSPRQVHRLFEGAGESVGRHIMRMRIEASCRDLLRTELRDWTITSIAQKWGFGDAAHFSRVFRRQTGVSPREFRLGRQAD